MRGTERVNVTEGLRSTMFKASTRMREASSTYRDTRRHSLDKLRLKLFNVLQGTHKSHHTKISIETDRVEHSD